MSALIHALTRGLTGYYEGKSEAEQLQRENERREDERRRQNYAEYLREQGLDNDRQGLELRKAELLSRGFTAAGQPVAATTSETAPPVVSLGGEMYRYNAAASPQAQRRVQTQTAKTAERLTSLRTLNATLPPDQRKTEEQLAAIAQSESLSNAWSKRAITPPAQRTPRRSAHPSQQHNNGPTASSAQRSLGVVDKQLGEARSDFSHLESNAGNRPTYFRTPSDSTAFERKKADLARARQKVDSLTRVRDSIGDVVQGKKPVAASQQQRDWDEAAAVLRNRGQKPEAVIGARPKR